MQVSSQRSTSTQLSWQGHAPHLQHGAGELAGVERADVAAGPLRREAELAVGDAAPKHIECKPCLQCEADSMAKDVEIRTFINPLSDVQDDNQK